MRQPEAHRVWGIIAVYEGGAGMPKPNIDALAARLDVQGIALQEMARALTRAQAATVADAVRTRVAELAGRDLSHAADAAVAGELVLLLDALTAR
jgi:hypothetical protein